MTLTAVTNRQPCDVVGGDATIQIALLRHAETGLHGCFCGHSDPSLSVQGQEHLPTISQSLSHIVPRAICSSDLRRARETAEPIARHFGLDYKTSPGFREMNFGKWEGLTWKEVELQYPDDAQEASRSLNCKQGQSNNWSSWRSLRNPVARWLSPMPAS